MHLSSPTSRVGSLLSNREELSTTGWIVLIVVLLVVFGGGFGWSRRGR
jgi:hypothetical protein